MYMSKAQVQSGSALGRTTSHKYEAKKFTNTNSFVAAEEAGASPAHQKSVTTATYDDTIRTIIYTGRPLRVRSTGQCDSLSHALGLTKPVYQISSSIGKITSR